eukprot:TRINITY_DN24692_c0_g1_i1.p1 TRINITY_DN24692_c0_g1~~TRINITY_DN24692_c0_g1_i1.p1  ORF type:complete len:313 (+),score=95.61 TRINITY_DN24692_c0_g1_i1:149-1087(+)
MAAAKPLRGDNVSVTGHSIREDGEGSHVQYHISVEWGAGGPWKVYKRYSEFESFHKILMKFYGKQQVPAFTKKKRLPVGGTSHGFVEKRMVKLEQYLREVVEQWPMWFQMGEEKRVGPGSVLGINEFIFEFLEFSKYAQIGLPATAAHEGEGVFVAVGPQAGGKGGHLPLLTGAALSHLVSEVRGVDLSDDDSKVGVITRHLSSLQERQQDYLINVIQLKSLLDEVFFQSTRGALLTALLPFVQDPENFSRLLPAFDFDEDIKHVTKLFQDQVRRRDGAMNASTSTLPSMADMRYGSPEAPSRQRGTALCNR